MKNVILTPNPYRDRNFQTRATAPCQILKDAGMQTPNCACPLRWTAVTSCRKICAFPGLDREIAQCRSGDLLRRRRDHPAHGQGGYPERASPHSRREHRHHGLHGGAGKHASWKSCCACWPQGNYTMEKRMMLDVTRAAERGQILFHDICAERRGRSPRARLPAWCSSRVNCDGVQAMELRRRRRDRLRRRPAPPPISMSAGGPIVEPAAKNIIITPICAHAMWATDASWHRDQRVVTVRAGAHRPAQRLSLRGRRQGLPAESGRRDHGSESSSEGRHGWSG